MRIQPALCSATLALGFAVACGGGQATTSSTSQPQMTSEDVPGFVPAPLYASLFELGRQWRYEGYTEAYLFDDTDPEANEDGMIGHHDDIHFTCSVVDVRPFPSLIASDVDCGGEDEQTIEGYYLANAEGLWRVLSLPETGDELPRADTSTLLFAVAPEPLDETDEDEEFGGHSLTVSQDDGGAWCRNETVWGGDVSGWSICILAGTGITAAADWWSGGSDAETSVHLSEGQ